MVAGLAEIGEFYFIFYSMITIIPVCLKVVT